MEAPNIPTLMEAVSVSKSYAHVISKDEQSIPLNLAAAIYVKTGWRHHVIAQLSDATVLELAQKKPWSPPPSKAKAA